MKFGQKRKDAPEISTDGRYLRNFKDGEVKVRFLEETDEWTVFREHYKGKQSFPCTGDRETCPGCTDPSEEVQRSSRKYGTNLYLVEVDRVLPFRIPVSVATSMDMRSEKNDGTITNRDYVIMRSGKGLDTKYEVDSDERYTMDIASKLTEGIDIEELLAESYEEVWGKEEKPRKRQKDEEELPSEPVASTDEDDDAGEVQVIDEDALYEMSVAQLTALAGKVGVDAPNGAKKSDLIRLLLAEAE